MKKAFKKRAPSPSPSYISPSQLTMDCFKSPFEQQLNPENRWVVLSRLMPWDEVCNLYLKNVGVSQTGRPPLSPRVILGSLIIKHLCNLDDRETVDQISENIYMQYFLGYSSFSSEPPFDASLFVDFRKRLGMENLNAINERIVSLKTRLESKKNDSEPPSAAESNSSEPENKGRVIYDATACPQDIAYPTDLDLLSEAREKTEQLIDQLYVSGLHQQKPRTYRRIARKRYLQTAQKKNKSRKEIHKSVGSQLRFVRRNLNSINRLLDAYPQIPLKPKQYKYLLVVNTLYSQQKQMYDSRTHSIEDRIVSIHQPHVRPIVRGKSQAKVEFGAKIHVSVIDGISFLDELSWDAFNEGSHMMDYVEQYRKRFGCYPKELLADQIYCTRANRAALKEKGIKLLAQATWKAIGSVDSRKVRESAIQSRVSLDKQKTGYGLNRIKARLKDTSESWIACIFLVLNLVKLAGAALPCHILKVVLSFSAKQILDRIKKNGDQIKRQMIWSYQIVKSYPFLLKIAA